VQVLPVDLNAMLLRMERNIAAFAATLHQPEVQQEFLAAASARHDAINTVMWSEASGDWRDIILPPDLATPIARSTAAPTEGERSEREVRDPSGFSLASCGTNRQSRCHSPPYEPAD
jgi:hypothetical protein